MSTMTNVAPGVEPVLNGEMEGVDVTDLPETLMALQIEELLESVEGAERERLFMVRDHEESVRAQGIFDHLTDTFQHYRVTAQFRNDIAGGIPNNPDIILAWLKSKTGITQTEQLRAMMAKTLAETQGFDTSLPIDDATLSRMVQDVADQKHMCVFKRDVNGQIYIESRQLKANIREATNILFATTKSAERFGATKKSPKSFVAERVFVRDRIIHLCDRDPVTGALTPRTKPSRVHTFTGHVSGPQGDRSALTNYEVCHQPWISFIVAVTINPNSGEVDQDIDESRILRILAQSEELGLGALRSQGSGTFTVTGFKRLQRPKSLTTKDLAKTIETSIEDF
jgi:hypothetical protein